MPLRHVAEGLRERGTPGKRRRYLALRRLWRDWRERLVFDALTSLNALNAARAGRRLLERAMFGTVDHEKASAAQEGVVARVREMVRRSFPPPPEVKKEEALRELLRCSDDYQVGRTHAREPLDISRLRVCKGDLPPRAVEVLCQGPDRKYILEPDRWIVKSGSEMKELAGQPDAVPRRPYWDPVLKEQPEQMDLLLKALDGAGLLALRRRRRAAAGCFFVRKKDASLRLVVGARIANACHRRPPHTRPCPPWERWPVSFSRTRPSISRQGARIAQEHVSFCGSAIDFTDGFYQFRSKRMAPWWCLGVVKSVREIELFTGLSRRHLRRRLGP